MKKFVCPIAFIAVAIIGLSPAWAQNSMQFFAAGATVNASSDANGRAQDPVADEDVQFDEDQTTGNWFTSTASVVNVMSDDGLPDFSSVAGMIASGQATCIPDLHVPQCNCISSTIGGGASSLDGFFLVTGNSDASGTMTVTVGPEGGYVTALLSILQADGTNFAGSATASAGGETISSPTSGVHTFDLGYYGPGATITLTVQTNATAVDPINLTVGIGGANGEMASGGGSYSAVASIFGTTAPAPPGGGGGTGGGGTGGTGGPGGGAGGGGGG